MKALTESIWRKATLPVLICTGFNLALFTVVAVQHPEYLTDHRIHTNPDASHYVLLGRNFLLNGDYSRCHREPYVPDILRTPVYPLFAGGLSLIGGPAAIYLAQMVLHVASCLLVYALARPYFGPVVALLASLLLATDLMLAISNLEAMSEVLFLFFVLAAVSVILPALVTRADEPRLWPRVLGSGVLLALATLTRPTSLYLPFIFGVVLLVRGLARRRLPSAIGYAALLLVAALLPVTGWIVRNSVVFGMNRLTNSDAILLVYFAGGGAYQIEHGITMEEAQARISREFKLAPPEVTNNHWVTDQPVAEMDAELRAASAAVLLKYPKSLCVSSLLSVVKASFSHNTGILATIVGRTWVPPGTGALLRGDAEAVSRLGENGPMLVFVFLWQCVHNVGIWLLALVGLVVGLRNRETAAVSLLLLVILLYFQLTVALVGPEAYYRSRTPHMPFVFVFAGLGAAAAWALVRRPLGRAIATNV